ncbi:MAG: ATP-binding cassette domain-containing protein, partial [Eubacteriales bacterium]
EIHQTEYIKKLVSVWANNQNFTTKIKVFSSAENFLFEYEISGGEEQKIALARALYKDSAFIILDEPTAALDLIAESEVYESFNNIVGDKTTIYISHRLSSCKFCDEIMVFNKGKIVEFGTHQNLLNQNGKYNELWQAQAQYYN